MVELLLTISLAAGGVLAMVAMTNVKSRIMAYERDLAVARGLANSFIAQLQGESTNWTSPGDFDATTTPLLLRAMNARATYGTDTNGDGDPDEGIWLAVPSATAPDSQSPRFNSLGVPAEPVLGYAAITTASASAEYSPRYCIHYRVDYVADTAAPGELLNLQVRVFWPVTQDAFELSSNGFPDCGAGDASPTRELQMAGEIESSPGVLTPESLEGRARFRFLQQSTVLYQHSEV